MAEEGVNKDKKGKKTSTDKEQKNFGLSHRKKILISSLIFLIIIFTLITVYFWSINKKNDTQLHDENKLTVIEVDDPDEVLEGAVMPLEPFVINLKSNTGILYLKVAVQFYDTVPNEETLGRIPAVRDFIIETSSGFSAEELLRKGPESLRLAIQQGINQRLPEEDQAHNVFIEQFLIR
ncbi:MAG TPA: flagellar basal body-associated FliL family protein [Oligoflexia bacterium]|nr:flagellar basal body-associated FliL family protein [Oligoflexia bacterium]HMP47710.1 flagellar basal body-associated FliL family protein [Oligoflexia bacterium]